MSATTPSIPGLFALVLLACASAPPHRVPPPDPVPAPIARPERPPLPPGALDSERRLHERDAEIQVFPFTLAPAAARPDDALSAVALAQLLVHALDAVPELMPLPLALDAEARPIAPAERAASTTRYFVGGTLARTPELRLTLWLMDRHTARVDSRVVTLDLPLLIAPRNALAELLAETALAPRELERADMTWYEDLDEARLALAGELIAARHRAAHAPADIDALVARADALAPYSFLVAAAVAEHLLPREPGCTSATVDRLSHLLSLHREVPFTLETYALSCALAHELSGEAPALPAWSRRSGAHCRIGQKGLTSVASTRGPILHRPEPGHGFVTGLGGLYRGDTCDAGHAVMQHAPEALGPPVVRAALELEAAFYFYALRDLPKSTRWFRRAQDTARADREAHCVVQLLGAEAALGLADLAIEDGREDDARAQLPGARVIAERCGDQRMLGRIANSEALLEQSQSRFDKALALFTRARAHFERVVDQVNLAVVDTNLGVTWLHLGRPDRAVPLLERALAGKRKVRSEGGIGVLLENLGVAELARGDLAAARPRFEQALTHALDDHTVATLHVQLARIALALGDAAQARVHMDLARKSAVRTHSRVLEAVIEQTDAAVAVEAGRFADALRAFHDALTIRRAIGDRAGEGITLSLLMTLAARMEQPAVAILYGKLAIEAHQEVRAAAGEVDAETAREFLATRADTYRQLAALLIAQGRLIEAERVMGLLKEDELGRWTRDASAPRGGVPLTVAERAIDERYQRIADRVMRLGREHGELAARWPRTRAEDDRLEALRAALADANQRFTHFLAELAHKSDALSRSRQLGDLAEGTSIGPDLADLGPGYVAVYTLVSEAELHLVVVSSDAQVARTVKVQERVLNDLVATLRASLQDPRRDPRPAARALYDHLIAPIAADLEQAHAKTVLWSLDRTLRYVPIGALHDGTRWALERWALAVFTPASNARMKDRPQAEWRVLALGVTSEHPPFPPLPAVADELAALVDLPDTPAREGVLPGLKALDRDFTKDLLLAQLTRRWPVVHLASHFAFTPGDKDASYLLLGDGEKLSVGELERLPNLFAGVDLLTLSACNTATGDLAGDGTEVESFAVLAQRKGARAVFASLWPVADHSTSALMRRFYALRHESANKLEALRKAQLELISATLTPPAGSVRAKPLRLPGADTPTPAPSEPLDPALGGWRHPYYWAPFILVGNVL